MQTDPITERNRLREVDRMMLQYLTHKYGKEIADDALRLLKSNQSKDTP